MKKYYIHDGNEQEGPFDVKDLKAKQVTRQTMIWFEGLERWKEAETIQELNDIFAVTPPPFSSKTKVTPPTPPEPKRDISQETKTEIKPTKIGGLWKIIRNGGILIGIVIGVLFVISLVQRATSGETGPLKIAINPPNPRIVESHANEDPSSAMFAFREGVWATILNQGGQGKILVKAILFQGSNRYERSEEAYLGANQTQEFHFVFTEPKRLGTDMRYEVTAIELE